MKETQELKEIRAKETLELVKEIAPLENKIADLQFRSAFKKLKNYRQIRSLKKRRARIWTILGEKTLAKMIKESKKESLS